MKKTWLSLALGFSLAMGAAAAVACPYHDTQASNDTTPPQQTAAGASQPTEPATN